ncbi:UNVERIFIED_CONTAM: hypothetical protein RMT77_008418 [Armadillidium vulgare]
MGVSTYILDALLNLILKNVSPFLVFSIVFLFTKYWFINIKRSPPGPWGLPIVGYLPFLGKQMHETLHKLSQQYGSVFQFSLGVKKIVVITDPELVRQTFKKEEFTGRPRNELYDMFQGYGVINIAGDRWKEQRRFLHENLRALGMKLSGPGREYMESGIMTEVENLLHSVASYEGKPMNVDVYLKNASANVICNLMMSVTFQKDSPIFQRFMVLHKTGFQLFMKADLANYLPFFRYFPSFQKCMKQLELNREESMSMLKKYVQERRENFDPSQTRDIIDAYLQKEYNDKLEGKEIDYSFDGQLLQVMCDLFSAGQETINVTLNWCLIFLLYNKDVTSKLQQELDSVVGRSRLPSLDDMPHLPYTEATICEVLRRSTVIPLGTPHSTTCDTKIGDYHIPANTTVFSNLYSCHMNPNIWDSPEKFDPTRFIDANGRVFKPKEFMPFGVGRRMCLGQILARSELFLFLSSILHVFNLDFKDGEKPSLIGVLNVSTSPEPYKIRFIPREISILNPKDTFDIKCSRGV